MGPLQPGIECSFCSTHSEVGRLCVRLSVIGLALTIRSWDLPDDVFTEGEVRPKKKAKAKANGSASTASADGDNKKRGAAEVSTHTPPALEVIRFGFLTMSSLILTAGNGTSRKATTAYLGRRCRLKRNEANRLRSPVLPTCPALMRPTAPALGANSCGNISWFETLALGTNAYCVDKRTLETFSVSLSFTSE